MNCLLRLLLSAPIDFAVGGQAVLEGVMMRSPHHYTVSVRNPEGKVQMQQASFTSVLEKHPRLNLPLLRGLIHLYESMSLGYSALNFSSSVLAGEEEEEQMGPWAQRIWKFFEFLITLGSIAFALFLLKALPLWVAEQASELWPVLKENYLLFNAVDGLTKITVFLLYYSSIALLKDMRRVFQYHGAEHKSIWAYEKGLPLTVENARAQTRFHPRCGTSFIFFVILMSVFVYTLVPPVDSFWLMLAQRIAVIPLIAGIGYETLKLSARFKDHAWVSLLALPGLFLQRITTREPDDDQLEVALHSLKASLEVEGHVVRVI